MKGKIMYELNQGSARLISVLSRYKEDPNTVKRLAYLLNYDYEQLGEDLKALCDFYYIAKDKTHKNKTR